MAVGACAPLRNCSLYVGKGSLGLNVRAASSKQDPEMACASFLLGVALGFPTVREHYPGIAIVVSFPRCHGGTLDTGLVSKLRLW